MKIFISITLFISLVGSVIAQVNVSGRIGCGFYSMKSLEKYQMERMHRMSEIPAQLVTDFPPYINYKAFISFPRHGKPAKLRYYYGFQTTGSRISLTDYSGKLTFDQTVNGHMLGIEIGVFSTEITKFINLRGFFCFGATASILKMNDHLEIWEQEYNESFTFYSYGFDAEPGVLATYKYKKVTFGLSFGYLQDFATTFYLKGDKETKLIYNGDQFTHPDWAGLRTGLEVSFTLSGKSKKSQ
jgi:hypothetical protein